MGLCRVESENDSQMLILGPVLLDLVGEVGADCLQLHDQLFEFRRTLDVRETGTGHSKQRQNNPVPELNRGVTVLRDLSLKVV